MLITASISDSRMQPTYVAALFLSAITAFLLAAEAALFHTQLAQCRFQRLYCRLLFTLSRGQERFDTYINAGSRLLTDSRHDNFGKFASGDYVPLSALKLD